MSWAPCTHPTLDNHSEIIGDERIWTCSVCRRKSTWTDDHEYFGTIECKKCWAADVAWVTCSSACRESVNRPAGVS